MKTTGCLPSLLSVLGSLIPCFPVGERVDQHCIIDDINRKLAKFPLVLITTQRVKIVLLEAELTFGPGGPGGPGRP